MYFHWETTIINQRSIHAFIKSIVAMRHTRAFSSTYRFMARCCPPDFFSFLCTTLAVLQSKLIVSELTLTLIIGHWTLSFIITLRRYETCPYLLNRPAATCTSNILGTNVLVVTTASMLTEFSSYRQRCCSVAEGPDGGQNSSYTNTCNRQTDHGYNLLHNFSSSVVGFTITWRHICIIEIFRIHFSISLFVR